MKGDRVRVVVDTGNGSTEFVVEASKAGRTIEVSEARGGRMIEVRELTRNGNPVLTDRFMASRIIAMVEERHQPDEDEDLPLPDELWKMDGDKLVNAAAVTFPPGVTSLDIGGVTVTLEEGLRGAEGAVDAE